MIISNLLSLGAEIILGLALPFMALVNRYRENKTPKTFFTVSKVFLFFSFLQVIIFYNYGGFGGAYRNNAYTSFFKIWIMLSALAWFFLSCKWFLNKDKSSFSYYSLGLSSIIAMMVMISTENLLVLFLAVITSYLLNYLLIYLSSDDFDVSRSARKYLAFSAFFGLSFVVAVVVVWHKVGSFAYADIYDWLSAAPVGDIAVIVIYAGIFMPLLFMIGLAPFHFWFADVLSVCILPICGFFTIVPVFAGFAVIVKVMVSLLFPLLYAVKPALFVFAVLSLFIGAVNANRETNIRRLFAGSTLFHLGFIFITLLNFNDNSVLSGFVYLLVYVLSMSGIYAVFLGFKCNGEYLYKLEDIDGVAEVRPYISAALLIFMFSLAGTPPMLGFLGKLSVINNLVIDARYWSIGLGLFASLLVCNAYLRVIDTVYFRKYKHSFDRVDKGVYIYLFINLVLVVISLLNPRLIMNDFDKMLVTVF